MFPACWRVAVGLSQRSISLKESKCAFPARMGAWVMRGPGHLTTGHQISQMRRKWHSRGIHLMGQRSGQQGGCNASQYDPVGMEDRCVWRSRKHNGSEGVGSRKDVTRLCSRPPSHSSIMVGLLMRAALSEPSWALLSACMLSHFSCIWLFVTLWTVVCRLLCSWESPGKNTGVGCHALLQGIFPTYGLNPCLLYHLCY